MNTPLLSVLIPTVVGRESQLEALLTELYRQRVALDFPNVVSFHIEKDNKEMTIGEKRERLYQKAAGLYSVQWDDDDGISNNGLRLIFEAIKQEPDCITFQEHCMINGVHYNSNHSLDYGDWEGDGQKVLWDGFHYHRTPFMKSVIKTEIAKSVPIPHIRFSEDHQWSQALMPHLKTEVHIPEDIYLYQHTSSNFNERYGYDRD